MDLPVIPRELKEQSVIEGNIYFFEKHSSFGVKDHMHVCIKRDDKLLFFSTCSSQINTARNIAISRGWSMDTFPIYAKNESTNKFIEDFTYVNCNACHEISVSDFVDLMEKGEVRLMQGSFSEMEMKLIVKGVLASTEVAREVKALFKK